VKTEAHTHTQVLTKLEYHLTLFFFLLQQQYSERDRDNVTRLTHFGGELRKRFPTDMDGEPLSFGFCPYTSIRVVSSIVTC